jgi:alpha-glucosidase
MKRWWRGAVIYQIYPRSFRTPTAMASATCRASSRAGLHRQPRRRRDLDLAVLQVADGDFGYDIADYRAVDPLFGTLEDFDRLLAKAHASACA